MKRMRNIARNVLRNYKMAKSDKDITKEAKRQLEIEKEKERLKKAEPATPGSLISGGIAFALVGFFAFPLILSFVLYGSPDYMFWANLTGYGSLFLGGLITLIGIGMWVQENNAGGKSNKGEKGKK
jgi:hypothetical protein